MKKYISVDKGAIAKNAANGTNEPVLVVEQESGKVTHADEVRIEGPSTLVYRPNSGRLNSSWIETDSRIRVALPIVHENCPKWWDID